MISGKLKNDTIWWISRDGMKVWIEDKQIEQEKFEEKGYKIVQDRIFRARRDAGEARKDVGELTTSRLERRQFKDAWVIKLDAFLDIYPELIEEIRDKEIAEKKKEIKKKNISKKKAKAEIDKKIVFGKIGEAKTKKVEKKMFDDSNPYVIWVKDNIDTEKEIIVPIREVKEKMGDEFKNMHDIRIYLGLKKILSDNIIVDLGGYKGEGALIIKKKM